MQPDRSQLGDTKLNEEEGLFRIKEENARLDEGKKIAGQKELEDPERAAGPRMYIRTLVGKLRRLNANIKFLDGSPGNIAVYVLKTKREMEESRAEDEAERQSLESFTRDPWFTAHKYVSGFPNEPIPEYSTVIVDERGIAKREVRGWRSVLIALIKAKAISYCQAINEFGDPSGDSRSNRWHEQLANYKHA